MSKFTVKIIPYNAPDTKTVEVYIVPRRGDFIEINSDRHEVDYILHCVKEGSTGVEIEVHLRKK